MSVNSQPIVYSCSGCSNVAQIANAIALDMDRQGLAQMSCIAGVGGNVKSIVRLAQSGRPIIALDGCALKCCENSLAQRNLVADHHIELTQLERIRKTYDEPYTDDELRRCKKQVYQALGLLDIDEPTPITLVEK